MRKMLPKNRVTSMNRVKSIILILKLFKNGSSWHVPYQYLFTYHRFICKKCPSKFNFHKDLRLFCDRRKERYLFIMIKNEQNEKHQTIWPWSQYWPFPQFKITAFCFIIIIIVRYKTTNNERNGSSLNGRTVHTSYNNKGILEFMISFWGKERKEFHCGFIWQFI